MKKSKLIKRFIYHYACHQYDELSNLISIFYYIDGYWITSRKTRTRNELRITELQYFYRTIEL